VTRLLVLWVFILFIIGFAVLTVRAASEQGFSIFTVISVFILVLLAVGVIGTLRNPPRG